MGSYVNTGKDTLITYTNVCEKGGKLGCEFCEESVVSTINHGQWEGCIGIEGMLLCEMPKEKHRQMKDYYVKRAKSKISHYLAISQALESRTGHKIHQERKSSVSGGRQLSAMDD